MSDELNDPWFAVESAVLELQENASFQVYLRHLSEVRAAYEARHIGYMRADDPKAAVQFHLGYLMGLRDAIARPDYVASGDARKAATPLPRSKHPAQSGARIAPADRS